MALIPYQLHDVLGRTVQDVDAAALERLRGWPESAFLEFKSKAKPEKIARAVASFANAGGGLFVLGIAEAAAGAAAGEAVGIEAVADQKLRVEQILFSRIQPPAPFSVGIVDISEDRQVVVIAVEAGPLRPHAMAESSKLSYPIRRGSATGHLTEPEVAEAYARRVESADRQRGRLNDLHGELTSQLADPRLGWVTCTILPERPGLQSVGSAWYEGHRRWFQTLTTINDFRGNDSFSSSSRIAYRGVQHSDDFNARAKFADLKVGGEGSASMGHLLDTRGPGSGWKLAVGQGSIDIYTTTPAALFLDVLHLLELLVAHADHEGGGGEGQVLVQLFTARSTPIVVFPDGTDDRVLSTDQVRRDVTGPGRCITRTVAVSDALARPHYLLSLVRSVVSELASQFGQIEMLFIDDEGAIVEPWAKRYAPSLLAWASTRGARVNGVGI